MFIISRKYNKMFQTQGSEYELTGSKLLGLVTVPAAVLVSVPVATPAAMPAAVPVPAAVPAAVHQLLVRKSTLYQSSPSYVKYGDCDSDDDNEDKGGSSVKNTKSFDSPTVKQAMLTMVKSQGQSQSSERSTGSGSGPSVKKRFPVPGQSSVMSQLFWCSYIACKGHGEFDMIANSFVGETEFKYETAELARGGKHLIKPAFKKYKLSLPNFEAELISSKRTTLQLMAGMALCHNKPVLYIDGRLFIEIKRSDTTEDAESSAHESEYTVIEKVKNRYCVYKDNHGKELARCNNELLKMESIDGPVRSIILQSKGT